MVIDPPLAILRIREGRCRPVATQRDPRQLDPPTYLVMDDLMEQRTDHALLTPQLRSVVIETGHSDALPE